MVTMREVAARAGVSTKSVSRVVNNDRYISADVRARVEAAIADLGYVPDVLARTLRSGRDSAFGVALPDLADPFFAAIVRGVEQRARERNLAVLVTSLGENAAAERVAVEALLQRRISGLVFAPISSDHSYLSAWATSVPLVFVDRPPRKLNVDSVIEDDFEASAAAVARLLSRGHTRIAFLGPDPGIVTVIRRRDGYRQALAGAGLTEDPDLVRTGLEPARTGEVLTDLLALPDPPTALFVCGSTTAADVVSHLHRRSRTDLAVISFGDFTMADALRPSVSVIDQAPLDIGRVAADRLLARLDSPAARLKRHVLLPVSYVERESGRLEPPASGKPFPAAKRPRAAIRS